LLAGHVVELRLDRGEPLVDLEKGACVSSSLSARNLWTFARAPAWSADTNSDVTVVATRLHVDVLDRKPEAKRFMGMDGAGCAVTSVATRG
jgi:hypothetical protein